MIHHNPITVDLYCQKYSTEVIENCNYLQTGQEPKAAVGYQAQPGEPVDANQAGVSTKISEVADVQFWSLIK